MIIQNLVNGLQWGSFYALIALGYTLVYGVLSLINFAHGDLFMVGAYVAYFAASLGLGVLAWQLPWALPSWSIIVGTVVTTMLLTAALGVLIERVAYRPLRQRGVNRLYVVITALMCGLILENGNLAWLGASRRRFPELLETTVYDLGFFSISNIKIAVFIVTALVFVGLYLLVTRSRLGLAMRAVAFDSMAVPLMGVPINQVIVFTFALGSACAALAGMLFGMSYPVLDPYMGALVGWKAFIAAVIGGIGDIRGALLGGLILGLLEVLVTTFFSSTYRDLFAFSILMIILTLRPTGIFGVARFSKV